VLLGLLTSVVTLIVALFVAVNSKPVNCDTAVKEAPVLEIKRLVHTDNYTMGAFILHDVPQCWALELPWRDNAVNVSCIPPGQYQAEKYASSRFGRECIKLYDVPGRSYISIHPGNDVGGTKGCILPGSLPGVGIVRRSNAALERLLLDLNNSFEVLIC